MNRVCTLCGAVVVSSEAHPWDALCADCAHRLGVDAARVTAEWASAPVVLMQGRPRQVFVTNTRALRLFGRETGAEGLRGGQLFGCANAFTELGCGKDPGCDGCLIKGAVVTALEEGKATPRVVTVLPIRAGDGVRDYEMKIGVEPAGELVRLRIERFVPR